MSFSCVISTVGILLLGQCHQHHNVSYPLLGRKAFGVYGYFLIAGQVAFSQFCFCASYYIFISTTIQNLFVGHGMVPPSTFVIMLLVGLALTPLGWIRRIGKMKVAGG
jgi:amino acid permease